MMVDVMPGAHGYPFQAIWLPGHFSARNASSPNRGFDEDIGIPKMLVKNNKDRTKTVNHVKVSKSLPSTKKCNFNNYVVSTTACPSACADSYGWFEFDEDQGHDLGKSHKNHIHAVDVVARWHEVGDVVQFQSAPSQRDVPSSLINYIIKRLLVRNYHVATRNFRPQEMHHLDNQCLIHVNWHKRLMHLRGAHVYFAWAIPEIRVVKEKNHKYAEYLVVCCVGETLMAFWKRYSDFVEWADRARDLNMNRTLDAWDAVIDGKKLYRCLDLSYLRCKSRYLEKFLKHLLFEVPSCADLLSFFLKDENNLLGNSITFQPLAPLFEIMTPLS